MIRRPVQWASLVARENAFWVRQGIMSPSFAEKCKRLETGIWLKLLVGLVFIECTGGFLIIACKIIRSGALLHK
jgi:hypothetical protein